MLILNKKNVFIKLLIIFFILINILNIKAFAVVVPTSDFYVNDYAGLLSTETKNYIINANEKLYSQTKAQIVVVTVPNLGDSSLEEYATQLFRNFGIGDSTKNNGVLLLLALEEREFRVEVGYGLEGILPDGKTGRIQDEYIIPYLRQNNWDDGIRNGFSAILQIVADEYNVDVGVENAIAGDYIGVSNSNSAMIGFGFIGIPFISSIVGMMLKTKNIEKKKRKVVIIPYIIIIAIIYGFIFKGIPIEGFDSSISAILFVTLFFTIFNIIFIFGGMSPHRIYNRYRWKLYERIKRLFR